MIKYKFYFLKCILIILKIVYKYSLFLNFNYNIIKVLITFNNSSIFHKKKRLGLINFTYFLFMSLKDTILRRECGENYIEKVELHRWTKSNICGQPKFSDID